MMLKILLKSFLIGLVLSPAALYAAGDRKPLDEKAYSSWYYTSGESLSPNGKWVSYEQRNMAKERFIILYNEGKVDTLRDARDGSFSANSNYFSYRVNTKNKVPANTYYVKSLLNPSAKSWEFPGAASVTFLQSDKEIVQILRSGKKKETDITLFYPQLNDSIRIERVKGYRYLADYTKLLYMTAIDSVWNWKIYDIAKKSSVELPIKVKDSVLMSCYSKDFSKLAILCRDGEGKRIEIFNSSTLKQVACIKDSIACMPDSYPNLALGELDFSECGNYLHFKVVKEKVKKEGVKTVKEKYELWKWDAPFIPPMKKGVSTEVTSHFCAYNLKSGKMQLLTNEEIPFLQFPQGESTDLTIAFSNLPYQHLEGIEPSVRYDSYLINMINGKKTKVLEGEWYYPSIASDKKFIVWFDSKQRSWISMDTHTLERHNITSNIPDIFYNDALDLPMHDTHIGNIGWSEKGHHVFINSKYDVWKIDASGKEAPVCITGGKGAENKIVFRFIKKSDSQRYYKDEELDYYTAFSPITKEAGYYKLDSSGFYPLAYSSHIYSKPVFSKEGGKCVFKRQSFTEYPNVYLSGVDFKNIECISNGAPQQDNYNWGTSRLVEWSDFNLKPQKGILCLPQDFDSTKKYPMLVYFYEKKSDELNKYHIPAPIGTVINWSYCTSNGYIVFIPDITFVPGAPGESSYNAVVSGVKELSERYSFIDKENIGLNGHSWGGYQSAYLVTRTNMFKAAVSGAPVVNMISGYGGIRWDSGKSRMFQYEHSQSRIGATLWENPEAYIKNSPIFNIPQINTPVLILHNDKDGSVMWEQGIEFFMAMRRLGKPAWLFNYKGANHKLTDWEHRLDYSRKVMEYYDYYLRGGEKPGWM